MEPALTALLWILVGLVGLFTLYVAGWIAFVTWLAFKLWRDTDSILPR